MQQHYLLADKARKEVKLCQQIYTHGEEAKIKAWKSAI